MGCDLALRDGMYSTYTAQLLVEDFDMLAGTMNDGEDLSEILISMEQQAMFLSDSTCEGLSASALATGGAILAHPQIWKAENLEVSFA